MLSSSFENRVLVAVQHERVAEPIRAAANQVVVTEALSTPAVAIVLQARVVLEMLMGATQELLAALTKHHRLLDAEKVLADDRASEFGVLGRHEVGMSPVGELGRECEHLWPEGGDDARHSRAPL